MGRSVSAPSEARVVCYRDVSEFDEYGDDWSWFVESLQETVRFEWPSFTDCDKWIGREDHALAENSLCYIGVSEYCGCAAIWIASKKEELLSSDYGPQPEANLCDGFIEKIRPKFEKRFGEFVKVATFSNGEAVYEKVG